MNSQTQLFYTYHQQESQTLEVVIQYQDEYTINIQLGFLNQLLNLLRQGYNHLTESELPDQKIYFCGNATNSSQCT